mgnify:CR=1 FL=1
MKKELIKLFLLVVVTCSLSIFIYYNADKVDEITKSENYLFKQNEIEAELLKDTAYTYENPKIIVNPYGNSPLTALVIFETKDLTAPSITVQGKDNNYYLNHLPNKNYSIREENPDFLNSFFHLVIYGLK